MNQILVTGFEEFSVLTHLMGNPSKVVAEKLGMLYGDFVEVLILKANGTSLLEIELRLKSQPYTGVLMLGANLQIASVQLESEGVEKTDGLFGRLKQNLPSTAAKRLAGFAHNLGVSTASAPPTALVYWCLRSYAAALKQTEQAGIPCLFLHLNTLTLSSDTQVSIVSKFLDRILQGNMQ